MRTNILAVALFLAGVTLVAQAQQSIDAMIDRDIPSLLTTYKMLHGAPELSHHEDKTSSFFATQLRTLGYAVTEHLGRYEHPDWGGFGVVAVMKNGAGPTVLVRTELDALPVDEKTNLPYASKVKTKNDAGQEVSVMHACGHDTHVAILMGVAEVLAAMRNELQGTVKKPLTARAQCCAMASTQNFPNPTTR